MSLIFNFHPAVESAPLPNQMKEELKNLFQANLGKAYSQTRQSSAPLGIKTQQRRVVNILAILVELRKEKFEITSVLSLKEKHIDCLLKKWKEKGQTKGTIENKLTYLGTLVAWTNRNNVVKKASTYAILKDLPKRSGISLNDKSWSSAGVDPEEMIGKIAKENPHVGVQLAMQLTFGLRTEESMLLRPFDAVMQLHGETYLMVADGTKGGRPRRVEVEDLAQLEVIELAKRFINKKSKTTIPLECSLAEWKNKYYYLLGKFGLTKKNLGVTAHGLRHQHFNDLYTTLTGEESPVRGGEALPKDMLKSVRQIITEQAGHSMPSKSNAYIGSHRAMTTKSVKEITDDQILQKLNACDGNKMKTAEELGCARSYLYKRLEQIKIVKEPILPIQ